MPGMTPGRRWQPPFRPFHRETAGRRLLASIERKTKGPAFGCRMCGNCLLQETAFICPMECPKGLRNGPCGGSTEVCYVDPTRPCVWNAIYERAFRLGREELLMEVLPPVDWDHVGTETWGDVAASARRVGFLKIIRSAFAGRRSRSATLDRVFRPVRQPDWWNGDSSYHPPASSEPVSDLQRALRSGDFVATAEMRTPIDTDTSKLTEDIELLRGHVTAMNFTEGASARARMSSLAGCQLAINAGAEPILQIAARDVTRIGLVSHVLGAAALGVRNVFVVTGDHPIVGLAPKARMDWVDLDSIQMLWVLRRMRDEDVLLDGRRLEAPPTLHLGAAASPFASSPRIQAMREHKKVNAGAQFLQTNLVFDAESLKPWLSHLADRGVLDLSHVLVGVAPLTRPRMLRHLHDNVPGVTVPTAILDRLTEASDPASEGFRMTVELIEQLRRLDGVRGVHIVSTGTADTVVRLLEATGVGHLAR